MSDNILKAIEFLVERIKKQQELPHDTSRDGVYFIDTEEGSCVEIIHNGMHTRMSCEFYEAIVKHSKVKEKYYDLRKGNTK